MHSQKGKTAVAEERRLLYSWHQVDAALTRRFRHAGCVAFATPRAASCSEVPAAPAPARGGTPQVTRAERTAKVYGR